MRKLPTILAVPLLVAACTASSGSPSPSTAPSPSTGPVASPTPAYNVPTEANRLVLRYSVEGGFVGPGALLTRLPIFALYGDGRVIVQGPADASFPSPLLPNVRQMQITPAEIQKLLAAADAAGLLGADASFDVVGVADAGTATFTTVVGGVSHTISAYALSESPTSTDPAIAAERAKLVVFQSILGDLPKFLGRAIPDEAYTPAAVRVYVSDPPTPDPSQPVEPVLTWPLSVDPNSGATTPQQGLKCLALTGTDTTTFLKSAASATMITVWSAPAGKFALTVRPLYPDESGCGPTA
jgi:hypothetical protein